MATCFGAIVWLPSACTGPTSDPKQHSTAYNFGPDSDSNRSVQDLVDQLLLSWPSKVGWCDVSNQGNPHEAGLLHLVADQSQSKLGWKPRWNFPPPSNELLIGIDPFLQVNHLWIVVVDLAEYAAMLE